MKIKNTDYFENKMLHRFKNKKNLLKTKTKKPDITMKIKDISMKIKDIPWQSHLCIHLKHRGDHQ